MFVRSMVIVFCPLSNSLLLLTVKYKRKAAIMMALNNHVRSNRKPVLILIIILGFALVAEYFSNVPGGNFSSRLQFVASTTKEKGTDCDDGNSTTTVTATAATATTASTDVMDLDLLMKNAAIKAAERDAWFESAYQHENDQLAQMSLHSFYGGIMLQPTGFCPADLIKTDSVRQVFDGGKWLCGASRLSAKANTPGETCVVYSLGCQFQTDFEMTVQRLTAGACQVHTYDPTLKPPERVQKFKQDLAKDNITLHEIAASGTSGYSQLRIGEETYPAQGIETMMKENNHNCIDVLKFDVEGAEYDILENTDWSLSCIGIILFELHGGIISYNRNQPYVIGDAVRHIRKLEKAGFVHYATEQVYVGGNAQAELAFVNITWLASNPGVPIVPFPKVASIHSIA